jgi:hypothetical protein
MHARAGAGILFREEERPMPDAVQIYGKST